MTKITIIDANILKRKLTLIAYAGLIAVSSYATIKVIGTGLNELGKYSTNQKAKATVENLIEQEKYGDAKIAIKLYENKGNIDVKYLLDLKNTLKDSELATKKRIIAKEKHSITTTLDSLINIGETAKATKMLRASSKLYSKPQIDSITKVIFENSEEHIYNLAQSSVAGEKVRTLYINKFANGIHRKEIITKMLTESYDNTINALNKKLDISIVSSSLNSYKKQLELFKSENIELPNKNSTELKNSADKYSSGTELVSQYKIANISINMPIVVGRNIWGKLDETYVAERNKKYPKGTTGKVFSYNDSENTVFVEFKDSCNWSRNWNSGLEKWTNGKKNVVAYSADELLYSVSGQKKEIISQDLSNVIKLLTDHYSTHKTIPKK